MNNKETIYYLRHLIKDSLEPVIGRRCILIDIPYYQNIGDVLIWEGEKDFLHDIGCECICSASYWTFRFPVIEEDVCILFNGGGNIGDLYPEHIEFLLKIIDKYPNNRIVILPQTVYYKDKDKERVHLKQINRHRDLIFCARDKKVANEVAQYIDNVLTIPDMAFYNNLKKLESFEKPTRLSRLIIKREDEETGKSKTSTTGTVADWPTLVKSFRTSTFINKIFYTLATKGIVLRTLWDWYFHEYHSLMMIKEGGQFISPYREVETTRLHGCILSILLDKKVSLIDNSYGKNSEFYKSWLIEDEDITLIQ